MKCSWDNCQLEAVGMSKYCQLHKKEARDRFIEMIKNKKEEKEQREKNFERLFKEAWKNGYAAGAAAIPTPMVVQQHANALDDKSPVTKQWVENDGVCGFAWIVIRPGNSPAANYAKKHLSADKHYYGGVSIWVSEFNQSYARKLAFAKAYAKTLQDAGINASSGGRLD